MLRCSLSCKFPLSVDPPACYRPADTPRQHWQPDGTDGVGCFARRVRPYAFVPSRPSAPAKTKSARCGANSFLTVGRLITFDNKLRARALFEWPRLFGNSVYVLHFRPLVDCTEHPTIASLRGRFALLGVVIRVTLHRVVNVSYARLSPASTLRIDATASRFPEISINRPLAES